MTMRDEQNAHVAHEVHASTRQDALKRLSYIEGHVAGVRKMVEQDQYCVDVLKQTFAIRRAIEKLEARMLEGHLHSCVIEGIEAGETERIVNELVELYALANK